MEDSTPLYGTNHGALWVCTPCQAWVGVHRGSSVPLGRLANRDLRRAKGRAHAAFDRLWLAKIRRDKCSRQEARGAGYKWLAQQLGIKPTDCHIGMFDIEMCERVVALCARYGRR